MMQDSKTVREAASGILDNAALPPVVERAVFQTHLDALRVREKAHTREADAIAAARRLLPMVEVDPTTKLVGPNGTVTLLDAFEGRGQLIAYFMMWHIGKPASAQCQGCTWCLSHMRELEYFHARDTTFAAIAQGPYEESRRYRDFMGWGMPWYGASRESLESLLVGRRIGMMHLVCYLRKDKKVYETYWTTSRGVEVTDNSYHLLDLTVYGRQEKHEDSPQGWPQKFEVGELTIEGRPLTQWARLEAGRSDDLANGW